MKALYNCANNIIALCSPEDDEGDWKYDQLIFFTVVNDNLIEVKIFNSDGSLAGNCLNGMRALTHFLYDELKLPGIFKFVQNKKVLAYSELQDGELFVFVDTPIVIDSGHPFKIDLGNIHHVYDDEKLLLTINKDFIPKINEEYIYKKEKNIFYTRVFEAGVGETGSCGSGAVAISLYAKIKYGFSDILVRYPGGDLKTRVQNNKIFLSGPISRQK